jgi:hypothetical protein
MYLPLARKICLELAVLLAESVSGRIALLAHSFDDFVALEEVFLLVKKPALSCQRDVCFISPSYT